MHNDTGNWRAEGKIEATGKSAKRNVVAGPKTDDEARAYVEAVCPGFIVEKITPLDGSMKVIRAAGEAEEPETPSKNRAAARNADDEKIRASNRRG
jgi:hypothetical protein